MTVGRDIVYLITVEYGGGLMAVTTFDKRRFDRPAGRRKFGKKVFQFFILGTKAESEKDAARLRTRGNEVRIIPWRGRFAVYIRLN